VCNPNYTPTILGVRSWREITSAVTQAEKVEYHRFIRYSSNNILGVLHIEIVLLGCYFISYCTFKVVMEVSARSDPSRRGRTSPKRALVSQCFTTWKFSPDNYLPLFPFPFLFFFFLSFFFLPNMLPFHVIGWTGLLNSWSQPPQISRVPTQTYEDWSWLCTGI
jgi:hypothetical protein